MKYFFFFLILLASCQDYNSNSGDRGRYGPVELNESDPNFRKAYLIIQDRCVSCHDHKHDKWAEFKSNQDWIDADLVVANDAANSEFIKRIVNTQATSSNMPPTGAIPAAEYDHLVEWVTNIP